MSKLRLAFTSLVVTGTLALGSSLSATSIEHTNYMTFSAPFALPGMTLPAGTYVFEAALAASSRDLVRVTSRDGRHVYLTAFTQAVTRPATGTSAPQIVFGEVTRGTPPAVKVWYPAGASIGHAFNY